MALIYADLYAPPTNWFRPDPFSPAAARSPCRLQKFLLSRDRTFLRKFNEILLALQIERELSKPEIMELYLNKIYLGNRAYGIEAAAQVYYGQSAQDLSLAQMAMIAGLPKAPSAWNPLADPERALIRRNWILSRMQALGYIDQETYQQAKARDISARYHGPEVEASERPILRKWSARTHYAASGRGVYRRLRSLHYGSQRTSEGCQGSAQGRT